MMEQWDIGNNHKQGNIRIAELRLDSLIPIIPSFQDAFLRPSQ
jgi:hypothetical protein